MYTLHIYSSSFRLMTDGCFVSVYPAGYGGRTVVKRQRSIDADRSAPRHATPHHTRGEKWMEFLFLASCLTRNFVDGPE